MNSFSAPPLHLCLVTDNLITTSKGVLAEGKGVAGMICPECLSKNTIIWDYKNGVLVCSACGTVLDKLYDFECNRATNVNNEVYGYVRKNLNEKTVRTEKCLRLRENRVNTYFKVFRKFNLRPGVRVKDEVIKELALGKKVKLVKTLTRCNAVDLSNVLSGPELEQARIILNLINECPRLASRTDRVKQALAVLILYKIKNINVSYSEIARKFHVDPANLMRAYKVFKDRYYEELIKHVKMKIFN